ncbi:MAG: hypothetical protein JWR07_1887 [Nevskia sp.]|nr:hypothetical protein [Nevskia sp.]
MPEIVHLHLPEPRARLETVKRPDGTLELPPATVEFLVDAVHHALHQLVALDGRADGIRNGAEIDLLNRVLREVLDAPPGPYRPLSAG